MVENARADSEYVDDRRSDVASGGRPSKRSRLPFCRVLNFLLSWWTPSNLQKENLRGLLSSKSSSLPSPSRDHVYPISYFSLRGEYLSISFTANHSCSTTSCKVVVTP